VQALNAPETIAGLGGWRGAHQCILLNNGVRCWGRNSNGQLGRGDTSTVGDNEAPNTSAPLTFGAPVKSIAGGASHTCALLTDSRVICWGGNGVGQLGHGDTIEIGDDEPVGQGTPLTLF